MHMWVGYIFPRICKNASLLKHVINYFLHLPSCYRHHTAGCGRKLSKIFIFLPPGNLLPELVHTLIAFLLQLEIYADYVVSSLFFSSPASLAIVFNSLWTVGASYFTSCLCQFAFCRFGLAKGVGRSLEKGVSFIILFRSICFLKGNLWYRPREDFNWCFLKTRCAEQNHKFDKRPKLEKYYLFKIITNK